MTADYIGVCATAWLKAKMVIANAAADAIASVVTQWTCARDGADLATRALVLPVYADRTMVRLPPRS